MAENAFAQIRETEMQAKAIIKKAQEEAAQIIKCAEEETKDAFLRLSEKCNRQGLENKMQTETDSQKISDEFSKETDALCVALKQKLSRNKAKALDAVIQMVSADSRDAS